VVHPRGNSAERIARSQARFCLSYSGEMPTPVGPAPRDPNDPDLWDWDDPTPSVRPGYGVKAIVAVILVIALVTLVLVSVL
jgi:hypothetical protein